MHIPAYNNMVDTNNSPIFLSIESTTMGLVYYSLASLALALLVVRVLWKTNLVLILLRSWRSFTDLFHLYQLYKVPQFSDDDDFHENRFYRHVSTYLASLPAAEDSDLADLVSGPAAGDVLFRLGGGQTVRDEFLGARLQWTGLPAAEPGGARAFVLRIRRSDRRRVFRQYLQRIQAAAEEAERRSPEIRFHVAAGSGRRRWWPVPFSHPASFDTVVVEPELKSRVVSDLELFLKSRQYYHRIGRVWRRSYLLCGASGTGKTSFAAAMARFLRYDVYDLDVARVSNGELFDLKALLLQTTPRSVIVVEDLGRLIEHPAPASLPAVLSIMDGIISCCGEERVLVFTMNGQDKERLDRAVVRPGRIDVHINLPLCDNFSAFKGLASNYLGLKEHKLFPQVEEIFQTGGAAFLSPAQISEIMLSNRTSPSRAIKSVISALQAGPVGRLSHSGSGRAGDEAGEPAGSVFCRESFHTVREFRKIYGLLKMGSRRKEEPVLDPGSGDKEWSRHQ